MGTKKIISNQSPGGSDDIANEIINLILIAQCRSQRVLNAHIVRNSESLAPKGAIFAVNLLCLDAHPQEVQDAIMVLYNYLKT